jgi:hypothetical protein
VPVKEQTRMSQWYDTYEYDLSTSGYAHAGYGQIILYVASTTCGRILVGFPNPVPTDYFWFPSSLKPVSEAAADRLAPN